MLIPDRFLYSRLELRHFVCRKSAKVSMIAYISWPSFINHKFNNKFRARSVTIVQNRIRILLANANHAFPLLSYDISLLFFWVIYHCISAIEINYFSVHVFDSSIVYFKNFLEPDGREKERRHDKWMFLPAFVLFVNTCE